MKLITAVILTAICILTSGCADSGDVNKRNPTYDSTGNYTYMVVTNDGGVGTVLCRFDIDSGIVTPMCTDPLCRHDDSKECLFANLSRCFARGDKIVIPTCNGG